MYTHQKSLLSAEAVAGGEVVLDRPRRDEHLSLKGLEVSTLRFQSASAGVWAWRARRVLISSVGEWAAQD